MLDVLRFVSNVLALFFFSSLLWCRVRGHALNASQKMTWQRGIWVMAWGPDPEDIITISHKWRTGGVFWTSCPSHGQSKGAAKETMDPSLGHHAELCMLLLGKKWKLNELHSGRKDSRVSFLDLHLKSVKPVQTSLILSWTQSRLSYSINHKSELCLKVITKRITSW